MPGTLSPRPSAKGIRIIGNNSNKVKFASCSGEDCPEEVAEATSLIQKLDRFTRRHSVRHCCSNCLVPVAEATRTIPAFRQAPFVLLSGLSSRSKRQRRHEPSIG